MPEMPIQRRSADLGTAPLGRLLVRLSVPGALGMLVMSLYNLVDTFWVSRLPDGALAIGALTVCFPLQMLRGAVAFGAHVGVASLVARRLGEGKEDEADGVAGHAVTLSFVLGLLMIVGVSLCPDLLLRLFGARPELMAPARTYLLNVVLGSPFIFFMIIVDGAYRGTGNLVTPMCVMATSAVANMVLDPLLIFGIGPFPAMGIRGAALATVAAQACSMTFSLWYLRSRYSGFGVRRRHLPLRWPVLYEIFRVGAPASVTQVINAVVTSVFNGVLGRHSADAIAAFGVTQRLMMVSMPIMGGVSFGLLPIVGYCYGAQRYKRMWRAVWLAAGVTSTMGALFSLVAAVSAPALVGVFSQEPALTDLAILGLRTVTLTMVIAAPQMVAGAALQGMGLGTQAMILAVSRQGIFLVPALLLLAARFGVGGAFASFPVADVCGFLTAVVLVRRELRILPAEDHPEAAEAPVDGVDVVPTAEQVSAG